MPEEVKLSVVVPIYNVEDYLHRCIDSLLKCEGIEDVEIILVDDGSTDGSAEIAGKYAADHANIEVLHKSNEGPSAARNAGLLRASGKYVFFCDSDDEVVPELFSRIISLASETNVDFMLWDSDLIYDKTLIRKKDEGYYSHYGLPKKEATYTGKQILETLLKESGDFIATVWLGAYKRSFLVDNGLLFEQSLIHEDEFWVPRVFINAQSVLYIPEKIYLYRIRQGSIMNPDTSDRSKHVASLMKIYPSLYDYYDEVLAGDPLRELIEGNLTKRYLHMIYKFRICRYGYGRQIDKKLLWRTSRRVRDKLMVLLLYVYAR